MTSFLLECKKRNPFQFLNFLKLEGKSNSIQSFQMWNYLIQFLMNWVKKELDKVFSLHQPLKRKPFFSHEMPLHIKLNINDFSIEIQSIYPFTRAPQKGIKKPFLACTYSYSFSKGVACQSALISCNKTACCLGDSGTWSGVNSQKNVTYEEQSCSNGNRSAVMRWKLCSEMCDAEHCGKWIWLFSFCVAYIYI